MKPISASHIVEIPLDQRIQLVEDIWDSIAEVPQSVVVPNWHKMELEKDLKIIMQTRKARHPGLK